MTIATQTDLIEHLGSNGEAVLTQVTDPTNTAIDSWLVSVALQRADHEIYAWIATVTDVPLTSPYPPLLVKIACSICIYWLWPGDDRTERLKDDYGWASGMLRDIAAGKVSLGIAGDGSEFAEQTENVLSFSSASSVFNRAAGDY